MLEQPFVKRLADARRILLAGCGGGYDVVGAIPLLCELDDGRREIHVASLSFCYLNGLDGARRHPALPNLYEVPAAAATVDAYCPEAWLARWLEQRLGRPQSLWAFEKTGVVPLASAYRWLVEHLGIDAIVLIDGGIDALLRGDETSLGTPAEDLASLAAVHSLDVPVKLLACVGLGAEIRDGICHDQVFDRMAELGRLGGYLGSAALLRDTEAGQRYRDAVEYLFTHQSTQRTSHVHKVVLAAMNGASGAEGPHVWFSPLLHQYWFFALDTVAETHLFLRELASTEGIWDVTARVEAIRKTLSVRGRSSIPI
jgi:hypothetical protein